ncbi:MAG: hypothetical protein JKY56_22835 [Kofleriaceae bacterium]|nr:hypothetical protein [Kofleriaceae bacterium]
MRVLSTYTIALFTLIFACGGDNEKPAEVPDAASIGVDISVDCPAADIKLGTAVGIGPCIDSRSVGGGSGTELLVRADCTDKNIAGLLDKKHLVLIPTTPTRDTLWVHFGGSGGQPTNTENIGSAAMSSGYRYISLAYPNEPSIGSRCSCPDGPRPADCPGLVRHQVIYGSDISPYFNMIASESIENRLMALLRTLDESRPTEGWGDFLLPNGGPDWTKMALSGFSQGGGMAGFIARDHLVQRVLYFSKASDGAIRALVDPATYQACTTHSECAFGICCTASDVECDTPPEDAYCLESTAGPVASQGKDTDGDGIGDGDASTRATPGNRQFAVVHRLEFSFVFSPEIFESWGMGTPEEFIDADSNDPPYDKSARLFSTALPPRSDCSEHQSMGADPCQPRAPNGQPAMRKVWLHAMTAPLTE